MHVTRRCGGVQAGGHTRCAGCAVFAVEPWDPANLDKDCFGGRYVPEGSTQVRCSRTPRPGTHRGRVAPGLGAEPVGCPAPARAPAAQAAAAAGLDHRRAPPAPPLLCAPLQEYDRPNSAFLLFYERAAPAAGPPAAPAAELVASPAAAAAAGAAAAEAVPMAVSPGPAEASGPAEAPTPAAADCAVAAAAAATANAAAAPAGHAAAAAAGGNGLQGLQIAPQLAESVLESNLRQLAMMQLLSVRPLRLLRPAGPQLAASATSCGPAAPP